MDSATIESLREILDHFRPEEEKRWREEGMPEDGTFFNDIVRVTEWLDAD